MPCIVHDNPFQDTPLDHAAAICLSHASCDAVANSTGGMTPDFVPAFAACKTVWKAWLAVRWQRFYDQPIAADAAREAADARDRRFIDDVAKGLK